MGVKQFGHACFDDFWKLSGDYDNGFTGHIYEPEGLVIIDQLKDHGLAIMQAAWQGRSHTQTWFGIITARNS
jgi:hypothetical protein